MRLDVLHGHREIKKQGAKRIENSGFADGHPVLGSVGNNLTVFVH